jgi:transposase
VINAVQINPTQPVIYVAVELSRKRWVIAAHLPTADKISRFDVAGGDMHGLLALIRRLVHRVMQKLGCRPAVVSCFEAGFDGFWLHRVLDQHGIHNLVLDSASIQVSRRSRRPKTDRLDAEAMIRVLLAYCRGETKVCSIVQVPTPEQEDARRPHRERERLVRERIQHVNRIQGLLATQGVTAFRPMRRDWAQQRDRVRTGDGKPLPPHAAAEIRRECRRLALVLEMLDEIEAARDAVCAASAAGDPIVHALLQLRGIGPNFAMILAREVFYRDFANRRALAGFVGLTPSPYDSGSRRCDQGISKAGNTRARSLLIEMAWLWLRYQPASALARWFRERVGATRGRVRRIAIVAVARKLLVSLWRYVRTGELPPGVELKAAAA